MTTVQAMPEVIITEEPNISSTGDIIYIRLRPTKYRRKGVKLVSVCADLLNTNWQIATEASSMDDLITVPSPFTRMNPDGR